MTNSAWFIIDSIKRWVADSILKLNNERLQTEVLVCVLQHMETPGFLATFPKSSIRNRF